MACVQDIMYNFYAVRVAITSGSLSDQGQADSFTIVTEVASILIHNLFSWEIWLKLQPQDKHTQKKSNNHLTMPKSTVNFT